MAECAVKWRAGAEIRREKLGLMSEIYVRRSWRGHFGYGERQLFSVMRADAGNGPASIIEASFAVFGGSGHFRDADQHRD